jgi:arylsulfatase A-like enzyme
MSRVLLINVLAQITLAAAGRPSFFFILSESLDGRLLRPDSLARIPNIRALLAGGSVRFDSAYSNSPVCAPSRSSLHSGRAPHKIAHVHNGEAVAGAWNNYEGLPDGYAARLDQLLNASGYATIIEGKTDWTVGGHTLANRLECITFNVVR